MTRTRQCIETTISFPHHFYFAEHDFDLKTKQIRLSKKQKTVPNPGR